MPPTTSKPAGKRDSLAKMINGKGLTCERLNMTYIFVSADHMYCNFVHKRERKYRMPKRRQDGTVFKNLKYALYANDVTFQ